MAAKTLLSVLVEQVVPALATIAPDRVEQRAALVGSQLLGIAVSRYIVRTPVLVAMSDAELIRWLRPVLNQYLTEPLG